jgi:hypothetical protein
VVANGQQRSVAGASELRYRPTMDGLTVLPKLAVDGEVTSKLRTTAEARQLRPGANYPRHRQDWRFGTGGGSDV